MTIAPALHSSKKMDWQTPDHLLERVRAIGPIAFDPATSPDNPTGAAAFLAPPSDGLAEDWPVEGLTYCNPPYGRALAPWSVRITQHEGEILVLVPSRTDTKWWNRLRAWADLCLFWRGRLRFKGATAPAPFPSCTFYRGPRPSAFRREFGDCGHID